MNGFPIFFFLNFTGERIGGRVSVSNTVPHNSSLRRKISNWRIADPYFCQGKSDFCMNHFDSILLRKMDQKRQNMLRKIVGKIKCRRGNKKVPLYISSLYILMR